MLTLAITIVPEQWDDEKEEFVPPVTYPLRLEHSLLSIHDWESKWKKPFLHTKDLTLEETVDYVKFMTLDADVDPAIYTFLSDENIQEIRKYIEDPMTATTFYDGDDKKKGGKKEIITAEIIYYWMIAQNIPVEYRRWHLNQLRTLIRVCSEKNAPPKKVSKAEQAKRYAELNAKRRKQLNTKG